MIVKMEMNKRNSYSRERLNVRADEGGEMVIEGYFAVFGQETRIFDRYYEQIGRGAFDNSLKNNDIRCLFNHDDGIVLGRTGNGTLSLRADDHGLFGTVKINPNDSAAKDIYERVKRGDISGCSFGFYPVTEQCEERMDGAHVTVTEADTAEVSICTFPAYEGTEISARKRDFEANQKEAAKRKRAALKSRLEGIKHGSNGINT